MLPDVLQAGMLAPIEPLLRAITSGVAVPVAVGVCAYIWMCFSVRQR